MKQSVLLLGASGMLGSMLLEVLSREFSVELYATVRNKYLLKNLEETYPNVNFLLFDAEKQTIENVFKKRTKINWIINAIGKIKPTIHDDNVREVERAVRINALFPFSINNSLDKSKVIQIATDCVYSGQKGKYIETDPHDALDVYGKTKSLGEVLSPNFINLRVSIIGPENNTQNSLFAWFINQKKNAEVSGFTNHFWNGITTLHFAKICLGMIIHEEKLSGMYHIVPFDKVTKAKLLDLFAKKFHRNDIKVNKINANQSIDRTLDTSHDKINKQLWEFAGYKKPPTIEEMIAELANYMQQNPL